MVSGRFLWKAGLQKLQDFLAALRPELLTTEFSQGDHPTNPPPPAAPGPAALTAAAACGNFSAAARQSSTLNKRSSTALRDFFANVSSSTCVSAASAARDDMDSLATNATTVVAARVAATATSTAVTSSSSSSSSTTATASPITGVYFTESDAADIVLAAKQYWDVDQNKRAFCGFSAPNSDEALVVIPAFPVLAVNNYVVSIANGKSSFKAAAPAISGTTEGKGDHNSSLELLSSLRGIPNPDSRSGGCTSPPSGKRANFSPSRRVESVETLQKLYATSEIKRRLVAQWLDSVVMEFGWRRATAFVAIHALDTLVAVEQQGFEPEGPRKLPVASVAALLLAALLVEDHMSIHRLRHFTRAAPGVTSSEQVSALQWEILARLPCGLQVSQTPEDLATLAVGRFLHSESTAALRAAAAGREMEAIAQVMDVTLIAATAAYENGCYTLFTGWKLLGAIMTPVLATLVAPSLTNDSALLDLLAREVLQLQSVMELHAALHFGLPLIIESLRTSSRPESLTAWQLLASWGETPNAIRGQRLLAAVMFP